MANYQTPGVYVEEISTLPPSVAEVETAIPAFIGFTQKGDKIPKRITSLVEYIQSFGTADLESMAVTIKDNALTDVSVDPATRSKNVMYYAMKLYFANGGGPCFIASVGNFADSKNVTIDVYQAALNSVGMEDEPTLLVFPDAPYLLPEKYYELIKLALAQCAKLMDRFAIIDVLDSGNDPVGTFRSGVTPVDPTAVKYGAAYYPYLNTIINYEYDDSSYFAAGSKVPPAKAPDKNVVVDDKDKEKAADTSSFFSKQTSLVQNQIKQKAGNVGVQLTPCAAVAGVYATIDNARGVWKAPANVGLAFVSSTSKRLTDADQEGLNIDVTSGKSVNAIRSFKGKGPIIWGARTLAGNDNEWRYINVRRFFNMVEESVKRSTSWAVFEANDINTWVKVRAMIENYLLLKWKDGALMGAKPGDAFFVRVGLGQTMSPQDVLEGKMIIEIGMAAVRPAEFIILRFSHILPKS